MCRKVLKRAITSCLYTLWKTLPTAVLLKHIVNNYTVEFLTVKWSLPTNQHPGCFTGRMPFLSPNQQCQSTEGKVKVKWKLKWNNALLIEKLREPAW